SSTATDFAPAIASLSALCRHKDWITHDPLGLGGLLFDADPLCQLPSQDRLEDADLLEDLMDDCRRGLNALLATRYLNRTASQRWPFRDLGLAIGLRGLGG